MTILGVIGSLCRCAAPDSTGLFTSRPSLEGDGNADPTPGAAGEPDGEQLPPPAEPIAGTAEDPMAGPAVGDFIGNLTGNEQASGTDTSSESEPPRAPEQPADAGADPPDAVAAPRAECAGEALRGVCWYLGADSQSCDDACSAHGGFSQASLAILGTPAQGGSLADCTAVLQALDVLQGSVSEGFREDGLGLGCHVFVDGEGALTDAWWLTSPALASAAVGVQVRRACGCVR